MEEKGLAKASPDPAMDLVNMLGAEGLFMRHSRCMICNSKHIKEIDKLCEERKTLQDIKSFIDSKGEISPSISNIANHVNIHFKKQAHAVCLAEWCDKMSSLRTLRQSRLQVLQALFDAGTLEYLEAVSLPTNGDVVKERERMERMLKWSKDIREIADKLNEMDDANAQVKAVKVQFVKVFKTKIENATNDAERQTFITALQDFKDLVEAMG